jgi:hypothetical protein
MSGSKNRRGGPHHHFLGGGRSWSIGLAKGFGRAAVATAAAALRLSAAASAGHGIRVCWFVRRDVREGCAGSGLAGNVKADFKRAVDESLAERIKWAGNRGRAWATEALVGQFSEDAVRICARLSALGEAEEAQSSTGGLLRRFVGVMTRSDKGNRCRLLCR